MGNVIRFGIVGTGYGARLFARSLPFGEGTAASAVMSRSRETARAFADAYAPAAHTHDNFEALIADGSVDVVYIATPNHLHARQCAQALEAGKPVLVEKPFAMTAAEARPVIELARRKRLFCMEAMWMRFLPLVRRAKQVVAEGAIGEAQTLIADFTSPVDLEGEANRFVDPALGGGALLDRGVYCLSLAFLLLGRPSQIMSAAELTAGGVDLHSEVLLRYPSGTTALLSSSLVSQGNNEAVIMGTTGTLRLGAPFYRPERLTLTTAAPHPGTAAPPAKATLAGRVKENALVRRALGPLHAALKRPALDLRGPLAGPGHQFEADEVARCVREGLVESPLVTLDDTLRVIEAMDEIRAQWKSPPAPPAGP
jgi:predicted dehydrogenase